MTLVLGLWVVDGENFAIKDASTSTYYLIDSRMNLLRRSVSSLYGHF